MKKTLLGIILLTFFLGALPSPAFAIGNVCCEKGLILNSADSKCYAPENPDDVAKRGDDFVENALVCSLDQNCDNSKGRPVCITKSGVDFDRVFGTIEAPSPIAAIPGTSGAGKLSTTISRIITILYIASAIAFVFMFVWGAFNWITSGGDKEALANARKRIVHAIIGIVLLALAFVIIAIIGLITGFDLFEGQSLIPGSYQKQIELQQEHDRIESNKIHSENERKLREELAPKGIEPDDFR